MHRSAGHGGHQAYYGSKYQLEEKDYVAKSLHVKGSIRGDFYKGNAPKLLLCAFFFFFKMCRIEPLTAKLAMRLMSIRPKTTMLALNLFHRQTFDAATK